MRNFRRKHLYLFLASIVICSLAVHLISNSLWKDSRLINEPLHSAVEAIGAAIAIFMSIVLLWGKKKEYGGRFVLMSMGFLGMGILDGFHAVSKGGQGFVLLRSVAGLTGGLCFSLIWLPGLATRSADWKRRSTLIVAGGSLLFGLWTVSARGTLPVMVQEGRFTAPAMTINLIAGGLFAISALRFIFDFHRSLRPEIFLFASMALLLSAAQLSFPFSTPWDITWWSWHLLRLIAYVLVLGFAVFERKEAEEEINKLNKDLQSRAAELEASYRDMESFSYSASHDLRSPLIRIHALSRILMKDYADKIDGYGNQLLGVIQENVKGMEKLISDLLAFSRVSTKEIQKAEINMEALTKEVFEELKAAVGNRSIHLEIRDLPSVYGDRSMMRQVFANLLSNAIKFTKLKETAVIEVGGTGEGEDNVYYVRDNGVGFDPDKADKLFNIFQRLHSQKEFEGTGIGLVIIKRIIEKHGGRVWAEGKTNEGARFCFALPRTRTSRESSIQPGRTTDL